MDPDEVYNLGVQSLVRERPEEPERTGGATGVGVKRLFEVFPLAGLDCKYDRALSSEMFGATPCRTRTLPSARARRMGLQRSTPTG